MSSIRSNKAGFTLIEMLVVIAIIAVLAALLLPVLGQGQSRAKRVQCLNNLKETGTAFHVFAHDHNGRFPMEVSLRDGGSLEFLQTGYQVSGEFYFSFRHFQTLSNDLVTPKPLYCPTDLSRQAAANFGVFNNNNLSLFVGVTAGYEKPNSILAGDRNITNDLPRSSTILHSSSVNPIHWTQELHRYKGNLLFADAHVQELNETKWSEGHVALGGDLVLPTFQPVSAVARTGNPMSTVPSKNTAPSMGPNGATPPAKPRPGNGGLALTMMVEARQPDAGPGTNAVKLEPNPAPPIQITGPTGGSTEQPFMPWMTELAEAIHLPVWLLWFLLLMMLAALAGLMVRRRPR